MTCGVHRIPRSTCRDDRDTPLFIEAGQRKRTIIFRKSEQEYFSRRNWTKPIFFGFTKTDLPDVGQLTLEKLVSLRGLFASAGAWRPPSHRDATRKRDG
jgi:hypothetical protein